MKKFVLSFVLIFALVNLVSGQSKSNGSLGLGLDLGNGFTFVGPSYRSYFSENVVGQGEILFGGGLTLMNAFYQVRGSFPTAKKIKWYAGGGPTLVMGGGGTEFLLRLMAGIEANLPETPLSVTFDWRPALSLKGAGFEPAFFGIGFRFKI